MGIDVYIPHHKYQVKRHSSPWFSAACTAAIAHRSYQQNKSESKVNFRQASNHCRRILEAAKLYANKTKESITSQKLDSWNFWRITFRSYTYKSAIPRRCCLLHLIKQNCLLKTFLGTLNLMSQVSLYQFSPLELL